MWAWVVQGAAAPSNGSFVRAGAGRAREGATSRQTGCGRSSQAVKAGTLAAAVGEAADADADEGDESSRSWQTGRACYYHIAMEDPSVGVSTKDS